MADDPLERPKAPAEEGDSKKRPIVSGRNIIRIVFFIALLWLEGLTAGVARPFLWPRQGEVVNGMWLACSHDGFYSLVGEILYPLLLLFFTAVNCGMLFRIAGLPVSLNPAFALIAYATVVCAAIFGGGETPIPGSSLYGAGYEWKWLGVKVQTTGGDCN